MRPNRTDILIAAAMLALLELEVFFGNITTPLAAAAPGCAVMAVALAWRRTAPLASCLVAMTAVAAVGIVDDDRGQSVQSILLVVLLSVFSAAAHSPRRAAQVALAATVAALAAQEAGDLIILGPLTAGTWAVGRLLRARHAEAVTLSEQAAVLERDRAEQARLAIAEERARIARELHDVVAHAVSTMTVQAGAERLALGDERPQTRETLEAIERTGREALAEMRRLVGILRREDEEIALAPQPSLAHLEALAEHMRKAGLPVELAIDGQPIDLPPGVDVSAYRIVQEALTNSLRHAGPARARVTIRYRPDAVEVEVADDGRAGGNANGGGHGLVGMRERVTLYGGDLEAGRRPGGGFSVRARLPLEPQR